jgi:uncharacterized protein (DUF1778 family)
MEEDPKEDPKEEMETIILSEKDWEIFLKTLENPPEPNDELKKLLKKD